MISGWNSGHHSSADSGPYLLAFAASPGLLAIICTIAFQRRKWREALGLSFRPNIWWLWAVLFPLLTTLATIALTTLLSQNRFPELGSIGANAAKTFGYPAEEGLFGIAASIAVMLLRNSLLFTVTEELGWRGYLYDLWRPFGFWRTSCAIGLIWGLWHWPMIYFYGLNYPNAPIIGMAVYPVYTTLIACVMTFLRDRGGSVWAAGIAHGALNTFTLIFLFTLGDMGWPWGVAGIGGIVSTGIAVIAIWCRQKTAHRPT